MVDNCMFGVLDSLARVTGGFNGFCVLQGHKWKFPSRQRRASAIRGRTWTFLRQERNEFEGLRLVRNPGPIPNMPGFGGGGASESLQWRDTMSQSDQWCEQPGDGEGII